MKKVFADACYWIALLNPKDDLHTAAVEASKRLGPCRIVTSEMVLVELLNGLGRFGSDKRKSAAQVVKHLEDDINMEIVPQTSLQFQNAVERYASRLDKEWGATDCASFLAMEERGMSEALTNDHHFKQAGFTILMEKGE
jgi:predicted nucleic acid-binding protein